MVDPDAGPTAPFLAQLGEQLRSRRQAKGLTLQQLADLAEVSRRMLNQIELGHANPSLVTVDKIARALGTDFAAMAGGTESSSPLTVNAPGARQPVWESARGSTATLDVTSSKPLGAELWHWQLQPGDHYRAQPDPTGAEELFLVLAGELIIEIDGVPSAPLAEGASARFRSDREYQYLNNSQSVAEFIRVVQLGP